MEPRTVEKYPKFLKELPWFNFSASAEYKYYQFKIFVAIAVN